MNLSTLVRSDDATAPSGGELRPFRTLLSAIVRRDLTVRYKQTLLGFVWALFVPVAQLLVFSVVFTRVVPVATDIPYPVYAYVGLLPWTFFAAGLQLATTSLTGNLSLVTKLPLPRHVFPIAAITVAFVDFLLAATVLGVLMAWYGIAPAPGVLALPLLLAVQVALMVGLGLMLAAGNVYYRDVRYLSGVLLTIWMFMSAVVYPVERVGGQLGVFVQLNPMTTLLNAYRAALLGSEWPAPTALVTAFIVAAAVLWLGIRLFRLAERQLAEVI